VSSSKSTDKINELLVKTPEYAALRESCRTRLARAEVAKMSFGVDIDYSNGAKIRGAFAYVHIGYGNDVGVDQTVSEARVAWPGRMVCFEINGLTTDGELRHPFEANFGVLKPFSTKKMRVPTFNVGPDKAKKAWEEFVKTRLAGELREDMSAAAVRLEGAVRNLFTTQKAIDGKQKAIDDHVVKNIKEVLLRFKGTRAEVLKRALDEFVCHEITEF